jgi:predicted Zn-dependent protease with MMP-like domain
MNREKFDSIVEEVLASLPSEFQTRLQNVAILVEDAPSITPRSRLGTKRRPGPRPKPRSGRSERQELLLGLFQGVPRTRKSVFDIATGPDRIVLYQKNIEAICSNDTEIREQIRLTVIHELGHYFGMDEDQLKDV